MDPEQRSSDSLTAMQKMEARLEESFNKLLAQTSSSLRQDIVTRHERLTRRLDIEHKEQQTVLFELKQNIAMKQSSDIAALEDLLSNRLEAERREQKVAVSDLQRELMELQAQVSKLKPGSVPTNGAAGLASSPISGADPQLGALEQATAATEAAISDLRRELNSQTEQLQIQLATCETSLASLRKEFLSQQGQDVRSLHEQLSWSTNELARTVQEVTTAVESRVQLTANNLRSEFRREDAALSARLQALEVKLQDTASFATQRVVPGTPQGATSSEIKVTQVEPEEMSTLRVILDETRAVADEAQQNIVRLAQDLAEQRMHSEAMEASVKNQARSHSFDATVASMPARLEEFSSNISKEVERAERRLSESLQVRMQGMESAFQGSLLALKSSLNSTESGFTRLKLELVREKEERNAAQSELRTRFEERLSSQEEAIAALRARDLGSKDASMEVGDGISEAALRSSGTGTSHAQTTLGSETHVALAACIGQLDAELRGELKAELEDRLDRPLAEIRKQIDSRAAAVEAACLEELSAKFAQVKQLEGRISRLESARLDLRLGSLEAAAQRASSFTATRDPLDKSALFMPSGAPANSFGTAMELLAPQSEVYSQLDISAPLNSLPTSYVAAARPEADNLEARIESRIEASLDGRLEALFSSLAMKASSPCTQDCSDPHRLDRSNDFRPVDAYQEVQQAPNHDYGTHNEVADPQWQPLISDELKERLENLVQQVRQTLNATQLPYGQEQGNYSDDFPPGQDLDEGAYQSDPCSYDPGFQHSYQQPGIPFNQIPRYHGSIALPIGGSDAREHMRSGPSSDYGGYGGNRSGYGSLQVPIQHQASFAPVEGTGYGYNSYSGEAYVEGPHAAQVLGGHVFSQVIQPGQVVGRGPPMLHSVSVARAPSPRTRRPMSPVREASPVRLRAASPIRTVVTSVVVPVAHNPRHRSPSPVRAIVQPVLAVPAVSLVTPVMVGQATPSPLTPSSSFGMVPPFASFACQQSQQSTYLPPSSASFPAQLPSSQAKDVEQTNEDSGSSDEDEEKKSKGFISRLFRRSG